MIPRAVTSRDTRQRAQEANKATRSALAPLSPNRNRITPPSSKKQPPPAFTGYVTTYGCILPVTRTAFDPPAPSSNPSTSTSSLFVPRSGRGSVLTPSNIATTSFVERTVKRDPSVQRFLKRPSITAPRINANTRTKRPAYAPGSRPSTNFVHHLGPRKGRAISDGVKDLKARYKAEGKRMPDIEDDGILIKGIWYCGVRNLGCEYSKKKVYRRRTDGGDPGYLGVRKHMSRCKIIFPGPTSNYSRNYKEEEHGHLTFPNTLHCPNEIYGCDYLNWGSTIGISVNRRAVHLDWCIFQKDPPYTCPDCNVTVAGYRRAYHIKRCGNKGHTCEVCLKHVAGWAGHLHYHQYERCPDHPKYHTKPVSCAECGHISLGPLSASQHWCGQAAYVEDRVENHVRRLLSKKGFEFHHGKTHVVERHDDPTILTSIYPDFEITEVPGVNLPPNYRIFVEIDEDSHQRYATVKPAHERAQGQDFDSSRGRRIYNSLEGSEVMIFIRLNPYRVSIDGKVHDGRPLESRIDELMAWLQGLSLDLVPDYYLAYFYYPTKAKKLVELSKPYFDKESKGHVFYVTR